MDPELLAKLKVPIQAYMEKNYTLERREVQNPPDWTTLEKEVSR